MSDDISQQLDPFADEAMPEPVRADAPKTKALPDKLPPFPLAAAGLSVFNGTISVGFLVLWLIDANSALAVIQALAGVCILLGLAAIVVGSLILNSDRRTGLFMPGSNWATVSIISGLFLLGVTVILPLISALSVLVGTDI